MENKRRLIRFFSASDYFALCKKTKILTGLNIDKKVYE